MAKQQRQEARAETPPPPQPTGAPRHLVGFTVDKVGDGRYLAVRITNSGGYDVLTPKRHNTHHGESKALAWQRVLEAQRMWAVRRGG